MAVASKGRGRVRVWAGLYGSGLWPQPQRFRQEQWPRRMPSGSSIQKVCTHKACSNVTVTQCMAYCSRPCYRV